MDQKDFMLARARSAMLSVQKVLEKILDDDDDAVLSAKVIGDIDGEEEMQNENTVDQAEDPIQRLRRETFERIAELAYKRTPADAERFFNEELTWMETPAQGAER